MNKYFLLLSLIMGVVVLASNYLVQFPINYYGLGEILTYGAFSYPIAFLITDLANRSYGKLIARKVVYVGFVIGIIFTLFFSTNFENLISPKKYFDYLMVIEKLKIFDFFWEGGRLLPNLVEYSIKKDGYRLIY